MVLRFYMRMVAHEKLDEKMTFFSAVSSSSIYAEHLGGTATFSGLVIGIPTAVSAVTLAPILKIDQGMPMSVFL